MNTSRRHKPPYQKSRAVAVSMQQPSRGMLLPFVLVGMLAVLVFAYVVLMNALTQKSFALKKLNNEVSALEHDGKRLEVDLAQKESMTNLADRIDALGMVPTEKLEYVNTGIDAVALR